jgi:hypothetical protein
MHGVFTIHLGQVLKFLTSALPWDPQFSEELGEREWGRAMMGQKGWGR